MKLEVSEDFLGKQAVSKVIDKSFQPKIGDVLSNDNHNLLIVQGFYTLGKYSYRINRSYNDHIFKQQWLKKAIQRNEAIWEQHKNDLKLFPTTTDDPTFPRDSRDDITYKLYLYYSNHSKYTRLYRSKYIQPPAKKVRVNTGDKIMVRVNHVLCNKKFNVNVINPYKPLYSCYWGRESIALSSLITQKFMYMGNIIDWLQENNKGTI